MSTIQIPMQDAMTVFFRKYLSDSYEQLFEKEEDLKRIMDCSFLHIPDFIKTIITTNSNFEKYINTFLYMTRFIDFDCDNVFYLAKQYDLYDIMLSNIRIRVKYLIDFIDISIGFWDGYNDVCMASTKRRFSKSYCEEGPRIDYTKFLGKK